MLKWSGGVTRLDKVRNEYIRGSFRVAPIVEKVRESRLRWYGHIQRRENNYVVKKVLKIPNSTRGEVIPEGKDDDDGLLEGIVKDVIDRISVFLVEAGYDPYRVDALGFQYKLPVTDLFAVNARAQNIALAGASNIVLHDIRYNPITFRLTFDVSLPRLSAAVGNCL
ncbi:uncharacterized protein LOC131844564 [Achroia grisella]|uniref:uncharacterized protein LOC131844564 n=1 Tax=Achroia grisella TaxID=688607 RepID=UPI0027D1EE70|nr:uncharacterized protein LOC131844564 [Achroia grisella]